MFIFALLPQSSGVLQSGENHITTAVRLIPVDTYFSESLWNTYGSAQVHIFAFDLN